MDGVGNIPAKAAVVAKKNKRGEKKENQGAAAVKRQEQEYRNTEIGKQEKNEKGIYYTNGNYEAFARPRKPEGVDEKFPRSAILIFSTSPL